EPGARVRGGATAGDGDGVRRRAHAARAAARDVGTRALRRRHAVRGRVEPRARVPGEAPLDAAGGVLRGRRALRRRAHGGGRLKTRRTGGAKEPQLFSAPFAAQPLAARMRPRALDEVVGQRALLAPGKAMRVAIESGRAMSMILWGP